jgi:hypothetical protein
MIKKIMWVLFLLGVALWVYVGVLAVSKGGNVKSSVSPAELFDKNNFDGSYGINYGQQKCGDLGYAFKLLHEQDGLSSVSAMNKSNCKVNNSGRYEGYIYAKKQPSVRVFWVETEYGVAYQR